MDVYASARPAMGPTPKLPDKVAPLHAAGVVEHTTRVGIGTSDEAKRAAIRNVTLHTTVGKYLVIGFTLYVGLLKRQRMGVCKLISPLYLDTNAMLMIDCEGVNGGPLHCVDGLRKEKNGR